MNSVEFVKLSKLMSYALRHRPLEFGLILDDQGWVDLPDFLLGLNIQSKKREIQISDVMSVVDNGSKKRFEVVNGKIRATYGHSTEKKVSKEVSMPPAVLYHGTTNDKKSHILERGLLPMKRQYVHLSVSKAEAMNVANRRKSKSVVLFRVNSKSAYQEGVSFYAESEGIWLSDSIPPEFLSIFDD